MTRHSPGAADAAGDSAARQEAFERVRKDLGGVWVGNKGETYEVMFQGATWRSNTWVCMRKQRVGDMSYTLRWDGEDCVIWGTDYTLLLNELRRNPGNPTWHSAKGKRPFVWFRQGASR